MQSTQVSPIRAAALVLAVLFLLSAGGSSATAATAPTNDLCTGAMNIPASGPFPYLTPVQDVSAATLTGDPVLPAATNFFDNCAGVVLSNMSRSVWFKFTPAAQGTYSFSVGVDTLTSMEDSVLAIYTSPSGCGGLFSPLGCNDDTGSENRAGVSTNLAAGTTYYIVVWGVYVEQPTNEVINVQLRVTKPAVPANDQCAGAISIPVTGFPYFTAIADVTLATETGDPLNPGCAGGVRSLWYKFQPTGSGTYVFSTATDTATTVPDTAMTLYTNGGNCSTVFTNIIACNDNGSGRAIITTNLVSGGTYWLVVWDRDTENVGSIIVGETSLQIKVVRAVAPTVMTMSAVSISSTSATLRAQINPNGVQSRYWFEHGLTTNYTGTNLSTLVSAGILPVTVSRTLLGFVAPNTYNYRVVSTNTLGKTYGSNMTFHWLGTQPAITSTELVPDDIFRVNFTATPLQIYVIEGASIIGTFEHMFDDWTTLGTAAEIGTGIFRYDDTSASNAVYRFYRVRAP